MGVPGSANPLLLASADAAPASYQVSRSLRFNSSDSAYLSRTPSSAGNRRTWTLSLWTKRSVLGAAYKMLFSAGSAANECSLRFMDSPADALAFYQYSGGGFNWQLVTTQVFRDPSAWYHIVAVVDSTQATSSERVKLYVNGTQVTTFGTASYPTQNYDSLVNSTVEHGIGRVSAAQYFDGLIAECHFIDGQALTPSSFAETNATTGQWVPKVYTGSYGTNGFKLDFSNNASTTTVSQDSSGNNNHWTANNISVAAGAGNDSLVDTPVSSGTDTGIGGEVRGNYCTFSPIDKGSSLALANGNLDVTTSSTNQMVRGTLGVKTGKWYYEATVGSTGNNIGVGIFNEDAQPISYSGTGNYIYTYATSGDKISVAGAAAYGASLAAGDVVGIALDGDNGTLTFYKNGSSQGTAYTGLDTAKTWFPCWFSNVSAATAWSFNFGQRPFAYPVAGHKCLNTSSLPAPLVTKSSTVFDTVLYTGTGSSQTISGLGFSPDLVWIKARNAVNTVNRPHQLFDTVREAPKALSSNRTDAEDATGGYDNDGALTAFTNDGFTVESGPAVGNSSSPYVAWAWDAGSTTVTNTQGSITSSVRANATAGFSIVTYTGVGVNNTTIGHGLGVAPRLIIIKSRSAAEPWIVLTTAINGSQDYGILNSTAAFADDIVSSTPTSTVFSVSNGSAVNGNTSTYVAYCWAPVAGYSSAGSFVTNGSADNSFVYTGFRPRFILYKRTDGASSWGLLDTARSTYNVANTYLLADSSAAEATATQMDVLSNGFKMRSADFSNGQTWIYFAWAENPFQYARAR